jgi:hypothetical protein
MSFGRNMKEEDKNEGNRERKRMEGEIKREI